MMPLEATLRQSFPTYSVSQARACPDNAPYMYFSYHATHLPSLSLPLQRYTEGFERHSLEQVSYGLPPKAITKRPHPAP
jgi:hypothetical protein